MVDKGCRRLSPKRGKCKEKSPRGPTILTSCLLAQAPTPTYRAPVKQNNKKRMRSLQTRLKKVLESFHSCKVMFLPCFASQIHDSVKHNSASRHFFSSTPCTTQFIDNLIARLGMDRVNLYLIFDNSPRTELIWALTRLEALSGLRYTVLVCADLHRTTHTASQSKFGLNYCS